VCAEYFFVTPCRHTHALPRVVAFADVSIVGRGADVSKKKKRKTKKISQSMQRNWSFFFLGTGGGQRGREKIVRVITQEQKSTRATRVGRQKNFEGSRVRRSGCRERRTPEKRGDWLCAGSRQ
jgi:hypothetical protein